MMNNIPYPSNGCVQVDSYWKMLWLKYFRGHRVVGRRCQPRIRAFGRIGYTVHWELAPDPARPKGAH
jgi:hypothetical protein